MSGLDKDRYRNKTISFRMSPDERRQLEARITLSGMAKGSYIIESLLHQQLSITVGKYQSDRLSLEFKKLRERLEKLCEESQNEEILFILKECRSLLMELLNISKDHEVMK